jgi:hypothetical protein
MVEPPQPWDGEKRMAARKSCVGDQRREAALHLPVKCAHFAISNRRCDEIEPPQRVADGSSILALLVCALTMVACSSLFVVRARCSTFPIGARRLAGWLVCGERRLEEGGRRAERGTARGEAETDSARRKNDEVSVRCACETRVFRSRPGRRARGWRCRGRAGRSALDGTKAPLGTARHTITQGIDERRRE